MGQYIGKLNNRSGMTGVVWVSSGIQRDLKLYELALETLRGIDPSFEWQRNFAQVSGFGSGFLNDANFSVLAINEKNIFQRPVARILFPTDFSTSSWRICQNAIEYARAASASISLMYVPRKRRLMQEFLYYSEMLKQWKTESKENGVRLEGIFLRSRGRVVRSIMRTSSSGRYQLIVMPQKPKKGWRRLLKGEAERVAQNSVCPVWMIPASD